MSASAENELRKIEEALATQIGAVKLKQLKAVLSMAWGEDAPH